MPCYYPISGYRSRLPNRSGKFGICFAGDGYANLESPIQIPCGQCIGCRLERSRQWAVRCVHEASLYDRNCFITLTYDDAHLPEDGSLDKSAFQKFMKRLRKKYGAGPRYFHCGEYGDQFGRPHYHACLFNFDFGDKVLFRERAEVKLYVSDSLQKLWPFGFSTVGDVTFESAAYVARYVVKKVTGERAREHYHRVDPVTGEYFQILPEYTTMSRRPGIGAEWYRKFRSDVYPDDYIVVRGVKARTPRYYDSLFELDDPTTMAMLKERRKELAGRHIDNNTPERLKVREQVKRAQIRSLKREVE